MKEIWKDVPNYEGLYSVSNLGEVKSLRFNKLLKQSPHIVTGYQRVSLTVKGSSKVFYIHRLVMEVFIGRKDGLEVNHIDGDKNNNKLTNLEWVTHHENIKHSHAMGLNKPKQVRGSKVGAAKLNESQVLEIKQNRGKQTYKETAKKYGVSSGTIYGIYSNTWWRHVQGGTKNENQN